MTKTELFISLSYSLFLSRCIALEREFVFDGRNFLNVSNFRMSNFTKISVNQVLEVISFFAHTAIIDDVDGSRSRGVFVGGDVNGWQFEANE